jgi:adenylate cyclase
VWKNVKKFIWEWRGVWVTAPAITILIITLRLLGLLQTFELASFDLYMRLNPIKDKDDRIVIVGINETDIRKQQSATFSDGVYAQLLTKLVAMKPRAIGLDIYRDIPIAPGSEELTKVFETYSRMDANPKIVGITKVMGDLDQDVIKPHPQANLYGSNDLFLDPGDQRIRRTILNITRDQDQSCESYNLFNHHQSCELYYSFGSLLALIYLDQEGISVKDLPEYGNWWQIGETIFTRFFKYDGGYVNVDDGGYQILLNYRGSNNNFARVSLSDVLEDKVPLEWGKDKIILIGHVGESSGDFFFTPYTINPSQRMAGVEIHANIVSQILGVALDDRPLIKTSSDLIFLLFNSKKNIFLIELLDGSWIFLWALIGSVLTWRMRYTNTTKSFSSLRLVFIFLMGILLVLITFVAYIYSWWIPVIPPLFALGGSAIIITAYIARMAGDIRNTFGRYLSSEIVATLLESPEGLKLGGERRKITILTSDLRGFTATSERLPPEEVVKIINFYLGYMADVITKYQGTIDEFMGDGILVLFGAPIARKDDGKRAIACAVEMQLAMKPVNEQMKKWGLPPLEMGIGINTGEVVVGNIGSEKRSKYGVVGSQVNLTYRIESYTIGGQIIISETTLAEANANVKILNQKEVSPKGVKKPITIYEVGGIEDEYQLFLPEDEEIYGILDEPIPLQYSVLEGKDISQKITFAQIIELSQKGAKIQLDTIGLDTAKSLSPPKALTNIKINFLNENKNVNSEDIYAKVLEKNISHKCFFIRFTAQPPEVQKQLENMYKVLINPNS